jgi:membrane protein DedA with SNARE-associated domain
VADPTEDQGASPRPRPKRLHVRLVVAALITLVVAAIIGDILTTTLADRHPLVLVALNSRNRVLVLTTNQLDALTYYTVPALRLLVSDPLFFLLGRWYGDSAIRWVERRQASYGEMLRWAERAFGKAAYPLVFIMPNNYICLFAGAAGMSIPVFIALNLSGTYARLYAIRVLGATFESPIDGVLDFFKEYRLPLLVISIVLVTVSLAIDRRKGGGELDAIRELEEELEEEVDD